MEKKLYIIIFILLFFFLNPLLSQQLKIYGKVVNFTNIPLVGVAVFLANYSIGTITDNNGHFTLELSKNNLNDSLVVNSIGYKKKIFLIREIVKETPFVIKMKEKRENLKEVVLSKNIYSEFSTQDMSQLEVFTNTSSHGDVLNSIQSMPVSTNTEESSRLNLRGSSYHRNRTYFNDVPLYRVTKGGQLDNSTSSFSIFNTAIVKNVKIYGSNPPIIFANSSGGVVNITTYEQGKNLMNVSLTSAGGATFFSKAIKNKNYIQVFLNLSDLRFLKMTNKESLQNIKNYTNFDVGINSRLRLTDKAHINFLSQYTEEKGLFSSKIFGFSGNYENTTNRYVNVLNTVLKIKEYQFIFNNGFTYSHSSSQFGNLDLNQEELFFYTGLQLKKYVNKRVKFQIGFDSEYISTKQKGTVPLFYYSYYPDSPKQKVNLNSGLKYVDAKAYLLYRINRKLSFGFGYRKNLFQNISNDNLYGYQINSRYITTDKRNKFIIGYGKYYSFNVDNIYINDIGALMSEQLTLEYNYDSTFVDINTAIFKKSERGNDYILNGDNYIESNEILGVELGFKKNIGEKFQLKISNIYLNSNVYSKGEKYNSSLKFNYFIKANLSAEFGKNFSTNVSWTSRPGLLYTPIENIIYNNIYDLNEPKFSSKINSKRYGDYNTVNINLIKHLKHRNASSIFFIGINNILNIKNQRRLIYKNDYTYNDYEFYSKRTIAVGMVLNFDVSKP